MKHSRRCVCGRVVLASAANDADAVSYYCSSGQAEMNKNYKALVCFCSKICNKISQMFKQRLRAGDFNLSRLKIKRIYKEVQKNIFVAAHFHSQIFYLGLAANCTQRNLQYRPQTDFKRKRLSSLVMQCSKIESK